MNAAIFFYLADVICSVGSLLALGGVALLAAWAIYTMIYAMEREEYHGKNWMLIWAAVAFTVSAFFPSTKTMYMMAVAVLGEQALESKVGHQLKEMLELKLQEELTKLKEKK